VQNKTFRLNNLQAQVSDSHDFTLRDVCRATAAAPTYLKPANIQSVDGRSTAVCADGAIVANNPVSAVPYLCSRGCIFSAVSDLPWVMFQAITVGLRNGWSLVSQMASNLTPVVSPPNKVTSAKNFKISSQTSTWQI
jgi:predicted acylesterase/phospholipase RssA